MSAVPVRKIGTGHSPFATASGFDHEGVGEAGNGGDEGEGEEERCR